MNGLIYIMHGEALALILKKLKLTFSGRSNISGKFHYDALRHHYLIDIYKSHDVYIKEILAIFSKRKISFFHGYPSAIYEFVLFLEKNPNILSIVKKT
jgi:hypothetical protein